MNRQHGLFAGGNSHERRGDLDDEDLDEGLEGCCICGGPLVPLGTLGNRQHARCRNCGMDQSVEVVS